MSKTLVLIDALNLVRRIFAIESNQENITSVNNTAQRVSSAAIKLLRLTSASHAVAVFDGNESWRYHYYDKYKATRKPMPATLSENMQIIEQSFEQCGIPVYKPEHDEADDIIATLATKAATANVNVVIISTDKGFLPHLTQNIRLYDYFQKTWIDKEQVEIKFGVNQNQLTELWAMAGDKTNDIPGIAGIGLKTAQKLLGEYGKFEFILNSNSLKPSEKKKIQTGIDDFIKSKNLVTLRTDIHLGFNLQDLRIKR
ncbi:flap endonuclease Xni [Pseudoalteromonas phenolica]|uniref:Flap endonuclease-like protein n=1 Tax=Pseudoalteromonas phenolica TaxID=161398 RepID=A0A0S2K8H4_9GAMM|nr:flap endonuclease Xni [Pseudoalteromonas phenolica]ALO44650.1 Flap endonuclease-like protein [Pseudoalteromonas phenolica]MBE0357684.1 protein Xni [Pseudoalteromonas phenolica O-BC30]